MTDTPTDQSALAELIKGRTDEEIEAATAEQGAETVLSQVFEAMAQRFNPSAAAGQTAVVQWSITASDGVHDYHVDVADGTCSTAKGKADTPRVTLALSFPDFLRFIAGELDGMTAFMGGKLKLTGDMMLAQSMAAWFA